MMNKRTAEIEDLGFFAIDKGDYQEALNIFKRAMDIERNGRNFYGFGLAFYKLGDLPAARWAFYKCLDFDPAHALAHEYIKRIETAPRNAPPLNRSSIFRTGTDYLEIRAGKTWKKFFIKGVNLGLALPGFFPGEYFIRKETYAKWFRQISDMGANSIRVYTAHPPGFYEALYEFNKASANKLYLLHGIWVELPEEGNDFSSKAFNDYVRKDIMNVIDVIYGNADLPERPGYAHGLYDHDVSEYLAAFVFGREWESSAVYEFNHKNNYEKKDFKGSFLSLSNGTPFEGWIAGLCDFLQEYEFQKYKTSHPLTFVNWPTLDALTHLSEATHEAEHRHFTNQELTHGYRETEDVESLDFTKIRSHKGGGFFASFHVYPYYPDFMNNDFLGRKDPYRAYLDELKRLHRGMPVVIAEFGVPNSREVTHWHAQGWHHGGHGEEKQGELNGLMMKDIFDSKLAGGLVFSWFDEWFKRNWLFMEYEKPYERNPLWLNKQDAEQNYGLLAAYPGYPRKKVTLCADPDDWKGSSHVYLKTDGLLCRFNDGHDASRELRRLSAEHDEGFLYILLEAAGNIDFSRSQYLIGLDTIAPEAGERLLPFGTNALSPIGLEFLIVLSGKETSRVLAAKSYDKYLNHESYIIRPEDSQSGAWVIMQNLTNRRRLSKDLRNIYPPRVFPMSRLKFGSLDNKNPDYDSLADFYAKGNTIELRIPWGLINVTDPSSRTVLWQDKAGMTRKTDGIRLIAATYKPAANSFAAEQTGLQTNMTDALPKNLSASGIRAYSWDGWDTPYYHTYLKDSYYRFKEALLKIPETL